MKDTKFSAGKAVRSMEKKAWNAGECLWEDVDLQRYLPLVSLTENGRKKSICYEGNPDEAAMLIASLSDTVYSGKENLLAWRHKESKHFLEKTKFETEKKFPVLWKTWRGKTGSLLFISTNRFENTDYSTTIIKRCK